MRVLPTLRQLAYLAALDEHRHFGRAAEVCGVTQPTLSKGLAELERMLGGVLVERTKRRVLPTPLGTEVAQRARPLLRGAEEIADLVAAAAVDPLAGIVRLGVIPTIGPFLLPKLLPKLRAEHKRLRLALREDLTERLIERLHDGQLDLLLIALPWPAPGLATMALAEDSFVLVCPADHPLASHALIDDADLASAELILLEDGHCLRDHALAVCQRPARELGPLQATSLATLVAMVASGLGVSLIPELALEAGLLKDSGVVARRLADPHAGRQIGLAWRASSPRAEAYRELAMTLRLLMT